jgi:dethiobiotin synthetase
VTTRPSFIAAVAGVATDVGKTWVATAMLAQLRSKGCHVSARKPVQSFELGSPTTDAHLLAAATGEDPTTVCPSHRWYSLAIAPPIAAQRLGLAPIALHDLLGELAWRGDVEIGVVETVGGVRSPLADDGDSAAFLRALAPDHVVLVADAGLGAINAVRLCVDALGPVAFTVMLNRFESGDVVHETNREWLAVRDGVSVATTVGECVSALLRDAPIEAADPGGRLSE